MIPLRTHHSSIAPMDTTGCKTITEKQGHNYLNCKTQYVGQTSRAHKNRFGEDYRRIKKPKKLRLSYISILGHTPGDVSVQPVEKFIYYDTSSSRFKTISRHET